MAYIDHITACNTHDLDDFVPFTMANGVKIGLVRKDRLAILSFYQDVFIVEKDQIKFKDDQCLGEKMAVVCKDLHERGFIPYWRGELYRVAPSFYELPFFAIERSATAFFGIRSYGVHINGFVRRKEGLYMWVAKRAMDRDIAPGAFDNMVAGGQPAGLGLMENVIKECQEEAGLGPEISQKATPVGAISYMMEIDDGLKPDVLFCYDLELLENDLPQNTDGEVESFHLMAIEDVARIVEQTQNFKFNCNLVVIDFLVRHGLITPETCRDYEALVSGLHQRL